MEEHTASAGDREAGGRAVGDREAGDRGAGDREAGDREAGGRKAGDGEGGDREPDDREEHCLAAESLGTKQESALAVVAAAEANARRVFSPAGGRERAFVAAR